jgi:PAS domain S-box-containing protein
VARFSRLQGLESASRVLNRQAELRELSPGAAGVLVDELGKPLVPVPDEEIRKQIEKLGNWSGKLRQIGRDGTSMKINRAISAQKLAEEQLRGVREDRLREEIKFRNLLEATPGATVVTNNQGVIELVNGRALTLFGYRREELLGQSIARLVPEWLRSGHLEHSRGLVVEPRGPALFGLRRDGSEFRIEIGRSSLLETVEGTLLVFAIRDVTESHRLVEEVKSLTRENHRQRESLAAVNHELEAFIYSVTHDLQAPMRHIQAFSTTLLSDHGHEIPATARNAVDRILSSSRRMAKMLDEMTVLSGIGRQDVMLEIAGLGALVHTALEVLKPETEGRDIDWRIGYLPTVVCDARLMEIALLNLLSNAVKFTRMRIPAVIEVIHTQMDGVPVIAIRDNGVGFDMKYSERLFGVFQRLHRREDFEGTGVGLATAQRIIRKHGGRIWASADINRGATFYLTFDSLPNAATDSEPSQSMPAMAVERAHDGSSLSCHYSAG